MFKEEDLFIIVSIKNGVLTISPGLRGMSRTNYSVKFKELSGMTPLDYLTYCRLEKAKQLLKESGKSVPEVSEAIGYPAHEHFQKLFKKKIGKTPSAYRKENSEKV